MVLISAHHLPCSWNTSPRAEPFPLDITDSCVLTRSNCCNYQSSDGAVSYDPRWLLTKAAQQLKYPSSIYQHTSERKIDFQCCTPLVFIVRCKLHRGLPPTRPVPRCSQTPGFNNHSWQSFDRWGGQMKGKAACCRQSAQSKQRKLQRETEMHQVLISTERGAGWPTRSPLRAGTGERLQAGALRMRQERRGANSWPWNALIWELKASESHFRVLLNYFKLVTRLSDVSDVLYGTNPFFLFIENKFSYSKKWQCNNLLEEEARYKYSGHLKKWKKQNIVEMTWEKSPAWTGSGLSDLVEVISTKLGLNESIMGE